MKILGMGIDLVKNSRIEETMNKVYFNRFLKKFLHPTELTTFSAIEN